LLLIGQKDANGYQRADVNSYVRCPLPLSYSFQRLSTFTSPLLQTVGFDFGGRRREGEWGA